MLNIQLIERNILIKEFNLMTSYDTQNAHLIRFITVNPIRRRAHTHTHTQSHTIDIRLPVLTLTPNISHYSDYYKCSIFYLYEKKGIY